MPKAANQSNRQALFEFGMRNKAGMPQTAKRYAIATMPKELNVRAMEK